MAEALESELWGPNIVPTMEHLEREHDSLRSALRWSIDEQDAAVALRLCAALWRFWEVRGHIAEGLEWLEQALAIEGGIAFELRAAALEAAGNLARSSGRYDRATVFYAGSLRARFKLGDKRGIALALTNLGIVAQLGGHQDAGVAHHDASFELFRELGDPSGIALSLVTLGTMAQLQGRNAAARTMFEESLAIFRAVADPRGIAASLNNLANIVSESGDLHLAKTLYGEALEQFRSLGDKSEEAACLKNLALVELADGAPCAARDLVEQSLNLFDDLADGRGVAACLDILAHLACAAQRYESFGLVTGAAQAIRDVLTATSGQSPVPGLAGRQEQDMAAARTAIGPERLTELCASGQMRPLHEVVEVAFAALTPERGPHSP